MSVVRGFESAFNRQDVDALVACFTERASYRDNFYGEHAGKDSLRSMFQRMFREGHDYLWSMDVVVESPTTATEDVLYLLDVRKRKVIRRIDTPLEGVTGPSWSPDGNRIVFSGHFGGISDLYMGVPVKLGAAGIEEIVELDLTDQERTWLDESAAAVRDVVSVLSS